MPLPLTWTRLSWTCPEDRTTVIGLDRIKAEAAVSAHFTDRHHEYVTLAGFTDHGPAVRRRARGGRAVRAPSPRDGGPVAEGGRRVKYLVAVMVSRRATLEPKQVRHAVTGRRTPRRGRTTVNAVCGAQVAQRVQSGFDTDDPRSCRRCSKKLEHGGG